MWLTTEELGDVPDVTAADIEQILPQDAFGKFAILSASEDSFIQAGNDWRPTAECRAYLQQHGAVARLRSVRPASRLTASGTLTGCILSSLPLLMCHVAHCSRSVGLHAQLRHQVVELVEGCEVKDELAGPLATA